MTLRGLLPILLASLVVSISGRDDLIMDATWEDGTVNSGDPGRDPLDRKSFSLSFGLKTVRDDSIRVHVSVIHFELLLIVGNLKTKPKWFFEPTLQHNFSIESPLRDQRGAAFGGAALRGLGRRQEQRLLPRAPAEEIRPVGRRLQEARVVNGHTVETVFRVFNCPTGNLLYIRPYPINLLYLT